MKKIILKLTRKQFRILESMYMEAIDAQYSGSKRSKQKARKFQALFASIDKQVDTFERAQKFNFS